METTAGVTVAGASTVDEDAKVDVAEDGIVWEMGWPTAVAGPFSRPFVGPFTAFATACVGAFTAESVIFRAEKL